LNADGVEFGPNDETTAAVPLLPDFGVWHGERVFDGDTFASFATLL
jgi:hypothetical protein